MNPVPAFPNVADAMAAVHAGLQLAVSSGVRKEFGELF